MIRSPEESPLHRMTHPESIVFFGASNNPNSMGTSLISSVLGLNYGGRIYPVHPKDETVQGLKAYRRVADLPEVPDLAVVVIPTGAVSQVLDECGEKGIRRAIVVSGGFREVGGEGKDLEKELVDTAKKHGIRFIGPNCIGIANPHHRLNTTFLPFEGKPGFIGMASQSGSFVTQMFGFLSKQEIGFSTAFSVGNEANVDIVDCLEYLGVCPNTRVIALYIEGIKRGTEFVRLAREIVPHKPIVALYVGGSESGRRAGFSHTGSLAGPDRLYDGAFKQAGVIRARTVTELFDFCSVLGALPCPRGNRVVIQTHSGGPGAAAADSCGRAGLDLPLLSTSTVEQLRSFIPPTASVNNPVDITFFKNPFQYFSDIPKALIEDENGDILLMYFLVPSRLVAESVKLLGIPESEVEEHTKKLLRSLAVSMKDLMKAADKPVVGYTFSSMEEYAMQAMLKEGIPVFPEPDRAARAAQALVQYAEFRNRAL